MQTPSPEKGVTRITADEIRGLNMKVEQNPVKGSIVTSLDHVNSRKMFPEKFLDYFIFIPSIKFHA